MLVPDALFVRSLADDLEQVIAGPLVPADEPLEVTRARAEEIVRRAYETVRFLNISGDERRAGQRPLGPRLRHDAGRGGVRHEPADAARDGGGQRRHPGGDGAPPAGLRGAARRRRAVVPPAPAPAGGGRRLHGRRAPQDAGADVRGGRQLPRAHTPPDQHDRARRRDCRPSRRRKRRRRAAGGADAAQPDGAARIRRRRQPRQLPPVLGDRELLPRARGRLPRGLAANLQGHRAARVRQPRRRGRRGRQRRHPRRAGPPAAAREATSR